MLYKTTNYLYLSEIWYDGSVAIQIIYRYYASDLNVKNLKEVLKIEVKQRAAGYMSR